MKKPNILYFIMDDFPLDDIGCYYGDGRVLTPNIDKLAQDATVFERAYCSSTVCTPSRYSHITGHYAGRNTDKKFLGENPVGDISKVNFNVVVNENIPSLTSILKDNGYQTGYSGKWHCGAPLESLGVPHFDADEDINTKECNDKIIAFQDIVQNQVKKTLKVDYAKSIAWGNIDELPLNKLKHHNLEWMTKGSLEMLDAFDDNNPFCLYMATSSFHGPLHHLSLLEADARYTWSGYDETLEEVAKKEREYIKNTLIENKMELNHHTVGALWSDYQFGKIIKRLEEKGVLDNTIIVFSADHGIEPGKGSCFEMGVRIPIIVKWADGFAKGERVNTAIQNVDLLPTLLGACKIDKPTNAVFDGVDIKKLLNGEVSRDSLYFEAGFNRAIIKGDMKYIALRYPKRVIDGLKSGENSKLPNCMDMPRQHQATITREFYKDAYEPDQLYDLKNDIYESKNLVNDANYQAEFNELKSELQAYLDSFSSHPYNLNDYSLQELDNYEELKSNPEVMGMDEIEWWSPKDTISIRERMDNILHNELY